MVDGHHQPPIGSSRQCGAVPRCLPDRVLSLSSLLSRGAFLSRAPDFALWRGFCPYCPFCPRGYLSIPTSRGILLKGIPFRCRDRGRSRLSPRSGEYSFVRFSFDRVGEAPTSMEGRLPLGGTNVLGWSRFGSSPCSGMLRCRNLCPRRRHRLLCPLPRQSTRG